MNHWIRLLAATGLVLIATDEALARVGGGESFGGGGDSGFGGGGDNGIGAILYILVRLTLEYPAIGIPLLLLFIGYMVMQRSAERSQRIAPQPERVRAVGIGSRASAWNELKRRDPAFSRVVLADFLHRLFVRYQYLQSEGALESLKPYLGRRAWDQLVERRRRSEAQGLRIEEVLVGAATVQNIAIDPSGIQRLTVLFEYNFGVRMKADVQPLHYFARDSWQIERGPEARSPSPQGARDLGCPSCGAAVNVSDANTCAYCGQVVDPGRFSWGVAAVATLFKQPRRDYNLSLRGGVEEGTRLPDAIAPDLTESLRGFEARYPGFDWEQLEQYARSVFIRLQEAWSRQSWKEARPFETDALFHTHRFSLAHLQSRGLVNRLERPEILRTRIVRVECDRYYDAVTIRIHARGLEYTIGRDSRLVAGSKSRPREFSEYWTFVRSAGFDPKSRAERDVKHCPNCGASLDIGAAGECGYCGSTITTGEFGWVLAAIEQDEAYTA
jgi:hypothetical protein